MITFRRFSKQWYWEANKSCGARDDVNVSDDAKGDGVNWEFLLVQHDFGGGKSGIQVRIFDDAVVALKNPKVVRAIVALKGCSTLDEAEQRLRKVGITELISKSRGTDMTVRLPRRITNAER